MHGSWQRQTVSEQLPLEKGHGSKLRSIWLHWQREGYFLSFAATNDIPIPWLISHPT